VPRHVVVKIRIRTKVQILIFGSLNLQLSELVEVYRAVVESMNDLKEAYSKIPVLSDKIYFLN